MTDPDDTDELWRIATAVCLTLSDDADDGDDLVVRATTEIDREAPDLTPQQERAVLEMITKVAQSWRGSAPDMTETVAHYSWGDLPRTVRESATVAEINWVADGAMTCEHEPRPPDGPAWTSLWTQPATVVCNRVKCRPAILREPPDFCMGCGADVPDPRTVAVLQIGALRIAAPLCPRCNPAAITTTEEE